ncbi:MAG: hypothetical protein AAFO07_04570 [Bacteroidota bacterium]
MNFIETKLSSSGSGLEAPKILLDQGNGEASYMELIVNGKKLFNSTSNSHFKNCIFASNDLKNIINLSNCTDIMFSHISCPLASDPSKELSTLIAIGVKKFGFIWSDKIICVSNHINAKINYGSISFNFNQNIDLISDNIPVHMRNDMAITFSEFLHTPSLGTPNFLEEWLKNSMTHIKNIIKNGHEDPEDRTRKPLVYGIYYPNSELVSVNLFKEKYVALLPVIMNIKWSIPGYGDWDFPIVTYLLAPVKENTSNPMEISYDIVYPDTAPSKSDPGLPGSDTPWPERWIN